PRLPVPRDLDPRHPASLPLRPADGPRLEGADPAVARLAPVAHRDPHRQRPRLEHRSHRRRGRAGLRRRRRAARVRPRHRPPRASRRGGEQLMGVLDGFAVTFAKLFKRTPTGRTVTTEYPKEKRDKPIRTHGRHVLNRYEDGMEKCIGCELCAGVCPARCIYVRGADNDPENPTSPGERYGYVYEINYLRCIHCDLCVEACPTEAITESKLFEFSFTNRQDAIYTKSELLVGDDGQPQHLPWEDWREGEDQHTSAWMRATSPGGDADFEGTVAWSGELGY